ncbi:3-hydroxybutyryl-CoA dehydrogenase [Anoxynatronum buryatiense]|uniref:3-hydroxybutyryl-CoA dehydrogenase n=1 Tax=Anoxynatronum buryatiense TaxID=489973 RepID=A0AA46AJC0_9CLOT|nr:3-hydroxybutyryl-CoA dehydrogenase [Anoxynatronum buryatiense]SMP58835.1 3-hydroxybutyryl-CoA dehydrogenase [Anoxynatronum buryatiense]
MKTIGVIGAGTMGSGIAQLFAQQGMNVVMQDINEALLERGRQGIEKSLQKLASKGKLPEEEVKASMDRLTCTLKTEDLAACDLVIEAAIEQMDIKKKILQGADAVCGENTILATNTSSLSITELAAATKRPDRFMGIHFFNPVGVMKLVELIEGIATSKETYEAAEAIVKAVGKTPVAVQEAPGFVVNRILIPMINEAVGILAEGVASKEAIDEAMKLGANHPIGPLALADLIGNDVCLAIMEVLYEEFADSKYRPHPLLRKMVRGNRLGRKTGEGFYQY